MFYFNSAFNFRELMIDHEKKTFNSLEINCFYNKNTLQHKTINILLILQLKYK